MRIIIYLLTAQLLFSTFALAQDCTISLENPPANNTIYTKEPKLNFSFVVRSTENITNDNLKQARLLMEKPSTDIEKGGPKPNRTPRIESQPPEKKYPFVFRLQWDNHEIYEGNSTVAVSISINGNQIASPNYTIVRSNKPTLRVLFFGVPYTDKNPSTRKLKYTAKDAEDMYNAFRDKKFSEFNVITECINKDYETGLSAINKKITRFAQSSISDDVLFIYFSGHGDCLGNSYILFPYDYNSNEPETSSLNICDLLEKLSKMTDAKIVLLIDACRSGAPADKGPEMDCPKVRTCYNDYPNVVSFRSSNHETSKECDQLENGVFTECVLRAFNYCDNADESGDGKVTFAELKEFLHNDAIIDPIKAQCNAQAQTFTDTIPLGLEDTVIYEIQPPTGEEILINDTSPKKIKNIKIWSIDFLFFKIQYFNKNYSNTDYQNLQSQNISAELRGNTKLMGFIEQLRFEPETWKQHHAAFIDLPNNLNLNCSSDTEAKKNAQRYIIQKIADVINETISPVPVPVPVSVPVPTITVQLTDQLRATFLQIIISLQSQYVKKSTSSYNNFTEVNLEDFKMQRQDQKALNQLKSDIKFSKTIFPKIVNLSDTDWKTLKKEIQNTHHKTWEELGKIDDNGQTKAGVEAEKMITSAIVTWLESQRR